MKRSHEAFRSANLFDLGCGYLVVSRFKTDGRVEAGFFLLDVFCLGVKDAGFENFDSIADYQESLLDPLFPDGNSVRMIPEAARKLTEGAISYARELGFSPCADYKKASRVFGGLTTANCDEQFVFGKDDNILHPGAHRTPAHVERILRELEVRWASDNFEPFLREEENNECGVTDSVRRIALERMEAGLRAGQPGMDVQIDPPGRRKVSAMIWLVG